ncbi:hypothetical protein JCM3766R1_000973 [Sporobolomyces carnicolor]
MAQVQRARSGSKTYNEVQAEERELARRRTSSRDRGDPLYRDQAQEEDLANQDGLSYGELRAEMETLLSLRRRSMSQPLTVDPDLPPTAPASSSPPPSSASSMSSAASSSTNVTQSSSSAVASSNSPSMMSTSSGGGRPKLSLTINTHLAVHPTGGPISPTAPSPAETGTLVRRKSSVSNPRPKLPSEHPLPPVPVPSLHLTSPVSVSHFSSSSDEGASCESPLSASATRPGGTPSPNDAFPSSSSSSSPTASATTTPTIIRSTSPSSYDPASSTSSSPPPTQELFWLPASLHPELAPQEFKAFIREQTSPEALARRSSSLANQPSSTLSRTGSKLGPNGSRAGGGVTRRSSMLRGEYKPRANDGVSLEEDDAGSGRGASGDAPLYRGGSLKRTSSQSSATSLSGGGGGLAFEELTIKDLQRLEELAQRAEREQALNEGEGEGERLGRVLRRSLSLNPHRMMAQAAGARDEDGSSSSSSVKHLLATSLPASYGSTAYDPDAPSVTASLLSDDVALSTRTGGGGGGGDEEDYDSPLIVPPPGQILRRNARTKIRKTGPGGEISFGGHRSGGGGGSRLGGTRRGRNSSDGSSSLAAATAGATDDDGASSVGGDSASVDSHDYADGGIDLRASTSSLNSINSFGSQPSSAAVPARSSSSPPPPPSSHTGPIESPPLDGTAQYLEVASPAPAIPHIEVEQPSSQPSTVPPLAEPVLAHLASSQAVPQQQLPPSPASTGSERGTNPSVSPASAEYDWASQHLPQSQPQQPDRRTSSSSTSAPAQYSVHPAHGPSLAPGPPKPQAVPVPVPQPERERSPSVSSLASSTKSSGSGGSEKPKEKEKKSGWAAKLGLGDKKRGKGKEKEKESSSYASSQHRDAKSETVMIEDRSSTTTGANKSSHSKEGHGNGGGGGGGTSNSLFGGLFGRRRNDYESPSSSTSSSGGGLGGNGSGSAANGGGGGPGMSAALLPPPPPTASGALLPNGRYANFYRLPIHVERAIYRLSHIKLANPRRPLYEQVLISNLMFWYLGLIQKPQPPPPAAAPVPVPGRRNKDTGPSPSPSHSPSKSGNKPASASGSGGGGGPPPRAAADHIAKHTTREDRGRDSAVTREQQQQQQSPPWFGSPGSAGSMSHGSTSPSAHQSSHATLPSSTVPPEYTRLPIDDDDEDHPPVRPGRADDDDDDKNDDDDDDDDRPLMDARPPPPRVATVPKPSESSGFEVTSRRITPPAQSLSLGAHKSSNNLTAEVGGADGVENDAAVDKRLSVLSNKSLSEIYDAYTLAGQATTSTGGGTTTPPRGSSLQATKDTLNC